jgi:hypothetical protein
MHLCLDSAPAADSGAPPEETADEGLHLDRAEHDVTHHASAGLHATRIARCAGTAQATCLTVTPVSVIGTHPVSGHQVLLSASGSGWCAGEDGVRVPATVGQAAYWGPGEARATGSDATLTVIALEGGQVTVFESGA